MSVEGPSVLGAHRSLNKVRLTDLAEAAGCSVATVSRALHDSPLISRATKARISQIARTRGYHVPYAETDDLPSALPRLAIMIGGQSPDDLSYRLGPLLGSLVEASRQSPCNLQISHLPSTSAARLEAILSDLDADGYLVFGNADLRDSLGKRFEKSAAKRQARILFWGEPAAGETIESIGPDNFAIGAKAVAHLAGAGCRRIAYLGGTQGADMGRRFMGYLTALNAAGLRFDADLILSSPIAPGEAGAFDGLFVASETLYGDALRLIRDARLSVSDAPRVVGYYNEAPAFPMETVSIDPIEAARRILARLFGVRLKSEPAFEKLPIILNAQ
jgi:DNA-binding LacI/PurR family transcriptional regulator